jgi:hypothetical protein
MINEMKEKSSMSKMSDLEHDKNSVEMMRYRNNKLSYGLGFGGLAFSVLAAFINLNSMSPRTVQVILAILLNIVILLFGFLCVERSKTYSKNGSIALIVLGGIDIAQIFWLPIIIISTYNTWSDIADAGEKTKYAKENVGAVITEGELNSIHWLTTNGAARGVLAIVFLVIAATFFISAGVIGVLKSNKLNNYLKSIKVES